MQEIAVHAPITRSPVTREYYPSARHIVTTSITDNTVTKIIPRPNERTGSNLLSGSACACASWTRTNMTVRHSMQYTVDLNVAMPPVTNQAAKSLCVLV